MKTNEQNIVLTLLTSMSTMSTIDVDTQEIRTMKTIYTLYLFFENASILMSMILNKAREIDIDR